MNLFYIGRKLKGRAVALQVVQEVLAALAIAPVNQLVLTSGLLLDVDDYEDAVQLASATASGLDAIITRNVDDFKRARLPVLSPDAFIHAHQHIFEGLAEDLNGD